MLSRVSTSAPTGSTECQVSVPTANAYPVFGANVICFFFSSEPSASVS